MSLQEKFQVTVPAKSEAGHEWETFQSNRDTHGIKDDGKFNNLPPGMDIEQRRGYPNDFKHGVGGDLDVSKNVTTPAAMSRGYARLDMKGSDDQYTGEHVDLFYGEAEDEEGNVGFAERNNMCDRL